MDLITRRQSVAGLAALLSLPLANCGTFIRREQIGKGDLKGRVVVEWDGPDEFIYRKPEFQPLSFQPSFMSKPLVPEDMYTDGGSIPRIFWNIPGLSPWGLGPAYIIHDWLFELRRCRKPGWEEITFEQSALILAEVGQALVDHGLIKHDMVDQIVWGVSTRYARSLWDQPGPCKLPPPPPRRLKSLYGLTRGPAKVIDFVIPPKQIR